MVFLPIPLSEVRRLPSLDQSGLERLVKLKLIIKKNISMKNMNNNIPAIFILFLLGLLSCDIDEIFKTEQYKNVFALVSGTDNIYSKYYDLREEESIGYLSASCGGTNPTTKDINISLVEDPLLIEAYNKTNYDVEYNKYAHQLSKSKYDIDSYKLRIPAGEIKASLPIQSDPRTFP